MEEMQRGSVCEVGDCVLVSAPNLISLVDFVCDSVSCSVSEFECDVQQNFSVFRKRSTSSALEAIQVSEGNHAW